jgi:hypothetical protein
MNEFLKKLYDSAVEYVADQDDGTKSQLELNRMCAEVFADSITYVCLDICEKIGDQGLDAHYAADEICRIFGMRK